MFSQECRRTLNYEIHAYHKNRKSSVLIDYGNSLNFMDQHVAKGLGCVVEKAKIIKVVLANGSVVTTCEKVSSFEVRVQRYTFLVETYLLPLIQYETVLGIPSLQGLGDIVWNFKTLTMDFTYNGTTC